MAVVYQGMDREIASRVVRDKASALKHEVRKRYEEATKEVKFKYNRILEEKGIFLYDEIAIKEYYNHYKEHSNDASAYVSLTIYTKSRYAISLKRRIEARVELRPLPGETGVVWRVEEKIEDRGWRVEIIPLGC